MSVISDNLKHLRMSHGMTQAEFAKIAGVSDKAVSTWENGLKMPRMGCIQKIADYFNIPTSQIIEDAGPYVAPIGVVPMSKAEITFIEKFRALDARGQSAVLTVLEHEYNAMQGDSPAPPLPRHA